jgi:hypothetical protein
MGEALRHSIGNQSHGTGTTGGDSDEGGGGKRQRASGSRCGTRGDRLSGRRASRDRKEASWGVVGDREWPEWSAHGEQKHAGVDKRGRRWLWSSGCAWSAKAREMG